jgi:hypothetical protein
MMPEAWRDLFTLTAPLVLGALFGCLLGWLHNAA